jgi:uncharacterized cupredoxin-like copper-binding protein
MHRTRLAMVSGIACLGLTAWLLGAATGPASGQVKAQKTTKVTVINVTIGKPTELGFTLSKSSNLTAGTFTFKVKNSGHGFHNFKICTSPTANSAKNSCVGKVTPLLKPGQTATLTVTLTKTGKYEYLCAVTGHAAAGMKGLLGVGTAVAASGGGSTGGGSTSTGGGSTSTGGGSTSTGGGSTSTGGGGGGTVSNPDNCPAGTTIATAGFGGDGDDDDAGGVSDGDGCI